ncbi:MAG TPA: hypothetical protein VEC93_15615, partial [Anaerolineae bacterium]|nr:hypothetical protein [Anaerolineae bacterium]
SLKIAIWHGIITALLALTQPTHIGYGIIPIFLFLVGGRIVSQRMARMSSPLRLPASLRAEPQDEAPPLLHSFAWLAAAVLLAATIFLPFAWPIFNQSQQGGLDYLTPANLTEHSTDLLAFIMPSPYNPLLAQLGLIPRFSEAIISGFRDLEEQLAYPGLVAVGLAGLAIWRCWRAARLWLGLTLICAMLSLGPLLKIGGQVQTLPLPYTWLMNLPFFAWSRTPGRLNETVMLGVAVLAALGAAWLLDRVGRWRFVVMSSLAGLILIEYGLIFPFPVEVRSIPSYYKELAQEPLDGAVLEVPVSGSRRASNYAMYYQTVHQHPLAGGYIERDPPGTVELKEFLNQLLSPLPLQAVFIPPNEAQRRAILADMKLRRVIAHPDLMTDKAAQAIRAYLPSLLGATLFADDVTLVYPLPLQETADLPAWQLLPDQESWEVVKEGTALRLKKTGYLFIYAAAAGRASVQFQLGHPAQATQLTWQLNDGLTERYALESLTSYTTEPLPLRQGLNYFQLTTEPAEDIEFLQITVQPQVSKR